MNRKLIIIAALVALGLTGLTVLNLSPNTQADASEVAAELYRLSLPISRSIQLPLSSGRRLRRHQSQERVD